MTAYDLIIIGGGPSGLNVGLAAEKAGLNFLILEKGVLVNSIYHFPTNMTFFSTSKNLEIGDTPFISHTDKPTRKEALEYYRRLQQAYNLKVKMYEPVQRMEAVVGEDGYEIQTAKGTYRARSVVVATGFYDTPRMLGVPGEDLPKVKHYYDDAHPYVGQKVLVIGAANSACDVALETYQKGAEVTMAVREHELYPKVKYWIKPNIENRIKEGSIEAHFNTVVKAIYPDRVDLEGPEGAFTIENDFVLAMTGYEPNYELLRALNLPISDDELALPIHDPETLVTPLPNVYLAGVVCAGRQTSKLFIENTRDHGEIIVQQIQAQQGIHA
ncbi:MAG: YpdA family putative bacillithiol disulfide reductase [Bacteroidota bacterium]